MMGLRFRNKKEAKEALAKKGSLGDEYIIETSIFGREFADGEHAVCISLDPYRVRNVFGQITVRNNRIVKIK